MPAAVGCRPWNSTLTMRVALLVRPLLRRDSIAWRAGPRREDLVCSQLQVAWHLAAALESDVVREHREGERGVEAVGDFLQVQAVVRLRWFAIVTQGVRTSNATTTRCCVER